MVYDTMVFFFSFFFFFFFSFLSKDISLYRTDIDNSDFVIVEVFILLKNSFYYYYYYIIIIIIHGSNICIGILYCCCLKKTGVFRLSLSFVGYVRKLYKWSSPQIHASFSRKVMHFVSILRFGKIRIVSVADVCEIKHSCNIFLSLLPHKVNAIYSAICTNCSALFKKEAFKQCNAF